MLSSEFSIAVSRRGAVLIYYGKKLIIVMCQRLIVIVYLLRSTILVHGGLSPGVDRIAALLGHPLLWIAEA